MEEVKRLFKPEFINRIDEIMVFHQLTNDDMKQIITLLSKGLCDRCKAQMDINLSFTNSLKEHLVTKYADVKMGARPLKRAVQNVVENELATAILEGRIKRGDTVSAGVRGDKVVFNVKNNNSDKSNK
jgi:ATP-dependent Clp protease ATP-binding subunit ClpC